jgi:hypothetical protein
MSAKKKAERTKPSRAATPCSAVAWGVISVSHGLLAEGSLRKTKGEAQRAFCDQAEIPHNVLFGSNVFRCIKVKMYWQNAEAIRPATKTTNKTNQ